MISKSIFASSQEISSSSIPGSNAQLINLKLYAELVNEGSEPSKLISGCSSLVFSAELFYTSFLLPIGKLEFTTYMERVLSYALVMDDTDAIQ